MCLHVVVRDVGLGKSLLLFLRQQGFVVRLHLDPERLCRPEAIAAEDTVIVDLDLPTGQAARLVAAIDRSKVRCRLIVMSGMTGRATLAHLRASGPLAVLTKPFSAGQLLDLL